MTPAEEFMLLMLWLAVGGCVSIRDSQRRENTYWHPLWVILRMYAWPVVLLSWWVR